MLCLTNTNGKQVTVLILILCVGRQVLYIMCWVHGEVTGGAQPLIVVLGIELKSSGLVAFYPLRHLSGPLFFLGAVVFD